MYMYGCNYNNEIPNKNKLAGSWKLDLTQEFHLFWRSMGQGDIT